MDLNQLSIRERIQENCYFIAQNFPMQQPVQITSCKLKEALFHTSQSKTFENTEESLSIMFDFLYGKNKNFHKLNSSLYQATKVIANAYLLKKLLKDYTRYKSKQTFLYGQLPDSDMYFESTIAFLAINLEEHIIDGMNCILQHHYNPILFATEVKEVLVEFKDFINPIIVDNTFCNNTPISVVDILNGKWRSHEFLHFLVYGGIHRHTIVEMPLKQLLEKIKFCPTEALA